MWYSREQRLTGKSGAMKRLAENIKVLYIASDCMEPYVEIITVKESKRCQSLCSSDASEVEEPEYLLEQLFVKQLAVHMPARTQGYQWQLVYSTAVHGSSLKTLYRNMAEVDSPVLLVVKDMHKKVFGAFSSDPFRVSKYCYGTGETFLFSFNPDFQVRVELLLMFCL
uniref:Nuclear receptor coactivator 7 n=1 Tax=Maylandia zebra TaxID=106582 RepID=A0A3P9AYP3_9CICH